MENNSKQTFHYLYIPGNRLELVKKAYEKKVKNIIVDLEDSVPLAEKEIVRSNVCEFVTDNDLNININIKINSDYEMQKKDIESVLKNTCNIHEKNLIKKIKNSKPQYILDNNNLKYIN